MARRRRAGDAKKLSKHERQSRARMHRIEKEDEDFEPEEAISRRSSLASSRRRRNDMMVIAVALIFIFSVVGGYLFYDYYLQSDENGGKPYTPPKPKPNGNLYNVPNFDVSNPSNPVIVLEIQDYGAVVIELYIDLAPITAQNFMDLSLQGKYDGTIFHRVIKDFMIQGGDFTNRDGTGGHAARYHDNTGNPNANPGDPNSWVIPDEFHPALRNDRETLSMANSGANTGGSQFFINVVNNDHLNNKHAVFGRVVAGMEHVDAVSHVQTSGDRPINEVTIIRAYQYQE